MAEDTRTAATDPRVQRGWQIAMAFGQGAGTMPATRRSLSLVFSSYGYVTENTERWDALTVLILEWARALGRAGAAHALRAGRCVIDAEDIEFAFKTVQKNELEPFGRCPLTDRPLSD